MSFRLYYVDDSGAPQTGWVVYSWVEVGADDWVAATEEWLRFRTTLFDKYGIPPESEIHSNNFLMGRGGRTRALAPLQFADKHRRTGIFCRILEAVRQLPGIEFGTVYRSTDSRRDDHTTTARDVYRELVNRLDARLSLADDHGIIIVDGDGTDTTYQTPHRGLDMATRRIVEDPCFHPAHANMMVQIADIVAYTAYLSIARLPDRDFAWEWYRRYLSDIDPREV